MASIYIYFKDGSKKEHLHRGRAGGSYTPRIKYEGGFAIVEDEWGQRVREQGQGQN